MRVLICGDRNWDDRKMILEHLAAIPNVSLVIEGEARGADSLGRECAKELKIPVVKFPADWAKYGRAAGPIRNQQMLTEGKPELVLAFHDSITTSKGTGDMVRRAEKAKIETRVIAHVHSRGV
jgi:YspA, cpYpsA-related SLOG family